jgi:Tfp pilus assembly protein PilV
VRPALASSSVQHAAAQTAKRRQRPARQQRGTSLVEALIAFVVLSLGILALSRGQGLLRLHADTARQRTEAVQFAQHDLESLRAYATLDVLPGVPSYAAVASGVERRDATEASVANASYRLERSIGSAAFARAKTATVEVQWSDRHGQAQQIVLDTIIAAADPAHGAALGLEPRRHRLSGALGRSALIPLSARDLGDGTSAFRPVDAGELVLVFDNASGQVSQRCRGVAAALTPMSRADMIGCTSYRGYQLSGVIRFDTGSVGPNDAAARGDDAAGDNTPRFDAPRPLTVELQLEDRAASASCSSEARNTVAYELDGESRIVAVPIGAEPQALGAETWRDLGEPHIAYFCVVTPRADGRWSGRSVLQPIGWTIGNAAGDYRVCRHVADLDGSGAIDRNIEHPDIYVDVDGPLPQQNFLVVDAARSCPGAVPAAGIGAVDADRGTLQHQP